MRKRLVIGAIAVAVIALVVSAVWPEPKEGTIEWHKERVVYLDARFEGRTLWSKMDLLCFKVFGKRLIDWSEEALEELQNEVHLHKEKLCELGYLIEREYVFTNASPEQLGIFNGTRSDVPGQRIEEYLRPEIDTWERSIPQKHRELCWIANVWRATVDGKGSCSLVVVAPLEYQPDWKEAVRKVNEKLARRMAEVPRTGQ